jgi:hypothetical protein
LPDTFRPTKKRSVSTLDAIVDKLTNFWFRTLAHGLGSAAFFTGFFNRSHARTRAAFAATMQQTACQRNFRRSGQLSTKP